MKSVLLMRKRTDYTLHFLIFFAAAASLWWQAAEAPLEANFGLRKPFKRVFDCFLYNGESEMLYTRLWRLNGSVTHFVLFMSNRSHSGQLRNISFDPFEKEINEYREKLYIIHKDVTCAVRNENINWCRENFQRNGLIEGVNFFHPRNNDLIFVSDADEIMTRTGIELILKDPPKKHYNLFALYLTPNYKFGEQFWDLGYVVSYSKSIKNLQYYRQSEFIQFKASVPVMTHCTYCFRTIEKYKFKFSSFAHQEFNRYPFLNDSFIFRMHYCRHHLITREPQPYQQFFDNEPLIPPDPRLSYLTDKDFRLNISQTIYKEADLPRLCSQEYSFFENNSNSTILKEKYALPNESPIIFD